MQAYIVLIEIFCKFPHENFEGWGKFKTDHFRRKEVPTKLCPQTYSWFQSSIERSQLLAIIVTV